MSNNIVPIKPEPSFTSYGLVPTSMDQAMRLADMMADAKLVPAALQKSPADCMLVIQQAVRWQMDPFAVAQECFVIQSKLMYSGKLVAAVINVRGNLVERLTYSYVGKGDDLTITVSGRIAGETEPRIVEVTLRNAKTANQQWVKQPEQQLMYHGARVWARRHMPELMLGVKSPEEEFDEEQRTDRRRPRAAPSVLRSDLPPHDPETGEIIDIEHAGSEARPAAGPAAPVIPPGVAGFPDDDFPGQDMEPLPPTSEEIFAADAVLGTAAKQGKDAIEAAWKAQPERIQQALTSAKRRYWETAKKADAAK
jgi:hypothetical protein